TTERTRLHVRHHAPATLRMQELMHVHGERAAPTPSAHPHISGSTYAVPRTFGGRPTRHVAEESPQQPQRELRRTRQVARRRLRHPELPGPPGPGTDLHAD